MAKQNKGSINEGEFWIINDEGKEVKYEVLFTFESEETHKNYIVYTNKLVDADGSIKIYVSMYDPEGNDSSLKPIESEKEWKVIETIFSEIQDAVEGKDEKKEDKTSDNGHGGIKISSNIQSSDLVTEEDISWDDIFADFPSFETPSLSMSYEDLLKSIEDKMVSCGGKLEERVLKNIASRLETETDEEHIDYLFKVLADNDFSECSRYFYMGMESYSNGNYIVAEEAFRRAVTFCQEDILRAVYANNLAYLLRRKEIRNPQKASSKEIVELLKPGVAKKDTFSLINMALFWALNIGAEDDWKMADELISLVSESDVHEAYLWWLDVGNKDEVEGQLVHLLLIRNGKIAKSSLGEMQDLFAKVKAKYAAIPAEFKNIVTPFSGGTMSTLPNLDDWL